MISHIEGVLLKKEAGMATVEVGGIGYSIHISNDTFTTLPPEGANVSFWTHLAVRENALDLYGFKTRQELTLFELLINVPGIGPKSGLGILSLATVEVLRKSIRSGDITYLTKVSGIGKKSAEKIVLELRDRLEAGEETDHDLKEETDVIEALQSLGYSLKESREALKKVPEESVGTSQRVRAALKLLGNAR